MRRQAIASLTGIRGVAATWVFLTHYQALLAACLRDPDISTNRFLYNGFRGVDLFFVLSGFIIMHVHGEEFRTLDRTRTMRFFILRFFRVYPLNTVVLLALVPLAVGLPDVVDWFRFDHGVPIPWHSRDFSRAGFVQSLLLAQTWTVAKLGEWNGPAWSMSAEVFGYALFPGLALVLMRVRSVRQSVAIAVGSLALLMLLLFAGHHLDDGPTGSFGVVRMIFAFIAGAALARAFHLMTRSGSTWTARTEMTDAGLPGPRWAAPLAWAALAAIVACLLVDRANFLVVFGFSALIFALAFERGAINAVLASRPAMFLGRVSFSFYVVHYIPLKLATWWVLTQVPDLGLVSRATIAIAMPFVCLVLAIGFYHSVERPFQRLARAAVDERRHTDVALISG